MPVKNHSLWQAKVGTVFAVAIDADKWGFVRFFRGPSMAVLTLVSFSPAMPNVDWNKPPIGWTFFSFAPATDDTVAIKLGEVPFKNEAEEWAPPCFDPPDIIDKCYRIHVRGMLRKPATAHDVEGMSQCRTMTPADLAQFLRERLEAGDLRPA